MSDKVEADKHAAPSPQDSSSVSSVNPDMLGDEIIVGTHDNGDKPSPLQVVSETEDADIPDAEDEEPLPYHPKRKRSTVYNDLGEDKMDTTTMTEDVTDAGTSREISAPRNIASVPRDSLMTREAREAHRDLKGVSLGYWRLSTVPEIEGKHNVIGFMDVRDRLRTRIQYLTRNGDMVNNRLYPIPSGPGGSWVTFAGIVFHDHLIGMNHNEIKEYVKLRSEMPADRESPDKRDQSDRATAAQARRNIRANPPPETAQPQPIAFGLDDSQNTIKAPEAKRRRTSTFAVKMSSEKMANKVSDDTPDPSTSANSSGQTQPTATTDRTATMAASGSGSGPAATANQGQVQLDPLLGTRPTRIIVGTWAKSDVKRDVDRHAVYGILGANDMFRVKLVRETVDGRYVDANFPAGAGALWIPYEEVIFLRHISHLNRPEVKEYVRVRQYQIDSGETEDEKISHETVAVYEAQKRVTANTARGTQASSSNPLAPRASLGAERDDVPDHMAMGHAARAPMPRHSLPEQTDMHPINQAHGTDPVVDRIQALASREVARIGTVQQRNQQSQFMTANGPVPEFVQPGHHNQARFNEDREALQRVWVSQQQGAGTMPPKNDDVKMHLGVKYERKQNGPLPGKLVSQGSILTIDGEDYVEYRVLTKPSFF